MIGMNGCKGFQFNCYVKLQLQHFVALLVSPMHINPLLFSTAFACCWNELSEPYCALDTAFVADVSPEILQALLNLAEFMEHDPSGGWPIEIPILANLDMT